MSNKKDSAGSGNHRRAERPDKVGASIMDWGVKHRLANSFGMKPAEFTGNQLEKLGVPLEKIRYCTSVHTIPITEFKGGQRSKRRVSTLDS